MITFYHNTDGDLDDAFEIDYVNSQFKVLYTEDTSKAGTYSINYHVDYVNYPEIYVTTNAPDFEITIVDPC